jgi:hypothetical protein
VRHPILLVDAFADRSFTGNPAGVMLLDAPLPEAVMQAVAMEMAQAETAFAVARPDGGWDLRWFTPTQETSFCGHATLATAHALAEAGRGGDLLVFHTREVGNLRVGVEGRGRYVLDLPRSEPVPTEWPELPFGVPGLRACFLAGRGPLSRGRDRGSGARLCSRPRRDRPIPAWRTLPDRARRRDRHGVTILLARGRHP